MQQPTIFRKSLAEFLGTFLLVFFGVGSVHTATLCGSVIGGTIYDLAIRPALPSEEKSQEN